MQFGRAAREPFLVRSNSPAIRLEDDLLGRWGTDDLSEPAQRRWPPVSTALIPAILAQEQGRQPVCGGCEVADSIFPRAAESTDRLVRNRRDIDGRQSARPHEPG
jgi:hypothetical protein